MPAWPPDLAWNPQLKLGKARIIFCFFPAALALGSCQRRPLTDVERGRAYYGSFNCKSCHKIGAEGADVAPDLTFAGLRQKPEWLNFWFKNPRAWRREAKMPDFQMNEATRAALIAYLMTLKGEAFEKTGRPWNDKRLISDPLRRGQAIFKFAGCAACHGEGGQGGLPNNNVAGGKIPALLYAADGFSKEELKERIRKGRVPDREDPNGPDPMIAMPAWGEVFSEDEMDALAAYLFSLKPPATPGQEW